MTQRNPMNDRYREENRGGKTRRSAASAKPTAERAATVRDPAPKTKKQKKEEAKERERKQSSKYIIDTHDNRHIENLPEYKRLRRIWWGCLIAAIVLVVASFLTQQNEGLSFLYIYFLIGGYAFVIAAFYIDFGKIRKLRRQYESDVVHDKSKAARAAQKAARAEAREQQKAAEANKAAAEAEAEAKRQNSPLNRLKNKFVSKPSSEDSQPSEEEPAQDEKA